MIQSHGFQIWPCHRSSPCPPFPLPLSALGHFSSCRCTCKYRRHIRQFNQVERLLQRKRHFEVEICDRLSVLRLFHVGHVRNKPKCRFTYLARIFLKPENERFTTSGSCWRQNFGDKKVSKCLKEMEIISAPMGGLPLTTARGSKPRNVDQPRNAAQWFTLKSFKRTTTPTGNATNQ